VDTRILWKHYAAVAVSFLHSRFFVTQLPPKRSLSRSDENLTKRRMGVWLKKEWSNILTIGCIVIAGIVEAYQEALSSAPKAALSLPSLSGWWHYAPAFLISSGRHFVDRWPLA
jgi:hypothetical protein